MARTHIKVSANKAGTAIALLIVAVVIVLYGLGIGTTLFSVPLYKLLLGLLGVSYVISKLFFGDNLRERFCIFVALSFLFMIFEKEIAALAGLEDSSIINNWLLFLAAALADIAIGMLLPKKKKVYRVKKGGVHIDTDGVHVGEHIHITSDGVDINDDDDDDDDDDYITVDENTFGDADHYADASKNDYHYFMTKMGNTDIYYQNGDLVPDGKTHVLRLECKMGNMTVSVPHDWEVVNEIECAMGNVTIRSNTDSRVRLVVKGKVKMG
ncbi:MAG: hypothetical protein IKB35_00920, partial [Clostridia bacterium]|nr:hypothetical protein [Clostridia bacterium]